MSEVHSSGLDFGLALSYNRICEFKDEVSKMGMKAVYILEPLHRELKLWAAQTGQTITDLVNKYLANGLQQERAATLAEQERQLAEGYRIMSQVHAQLAEESVQFVADVLPPDDWQGCWDE